MHRPSQALARILYPTQKSRLCSQTSCAQTPDHRQGGHVLSIMVCRWCRSKVRVEVAETTHLPNGEVDSCPVFVLSSKLSQRVYVILVVCVE